MKKKSILYSALFLMLVVAGSAGASTILMTIGRSPFHQPPLTTEESLRTMVLEKAADVKIGFEKAGLGELASPFISQIKGADIEAVQFQKGSWFEWMMFKRGGVGAVRVAKDVTWANAKPFPGYKITIEHEGSLYTFAVPLGCGNIALMGKKALPEVVAPAPAPVPVANQSPLCAMTVSSVRAFCGEIITVDASGSQDDGSIETMTIAFVDDQGQVVSEEVVDGGALVGNVAVPCGANTLKVTVTDNEGETAGSMECTTTVTGLKRTRFVADLGYFRQEDPADYIFGRVGLEYRINEEFGVLGMVGFSPQVDGIDGDDALLIDLLGEYSFGSRYFIDFGIGGWITDGDDDIDAEDTQLDVIAGIGARVYGEPESFNASVFLEARSGIDELSSSDIIDYGRFGLGVRFKF